jgi:hypothetical protein
MELQLMIAQMKENARRIHALAEGVSPEQGGWKPDPAVWSILEVLGHLLDEERLDFRPRLDVILHQPGGSWQPIDPMGWVTAHQYSSLSLPAVLADFQAERRASLEWLAGLGRPDWQTVFQAPFGPITAGDMLSAWAAHDLLHLRQLVELHYAWLSQQAAPFTTRYAGDW